MKHNSLEIIDRKNTLVKRNLEILSLCKKEIRELTEEEEQEMKANEDEIAELDEEQKELDKELEEEKNDEEEKVEEKSLKNISIDKKSMETKKFSLVEAIKRSMTTHEPIDLRAYQVSGQNGEGEDVVAVDVWDVWEPLRQENVLAGLGAQIYSGLVGDVQIPILSAANVHFAGEIDAAQDGSGQFTHVSLSPKRITGKFPISLQFLAQTTPDVEAAIRRDIAAAVNSKLEETLLGDAAASATQPAGLFNGLTATEVADYRDVLNLVAGLKEKNYKDVKFAMAPMAEAGLSAMIKGTNATGMVMDNGRVAGYEAAVTSNIDENLFLVGDFSNVVIGLWDNVRIDVVADSTTLSNGQIMIIVNAFVDAKLGRADALVAGEVAE